MRAIMRIGCTLTILLSQSVAASTDRIPSEGALREACSAFSEAGMRECLDNEVDESSRILAQAEDDLRRAISKWDEDGKYIRSAKAKLAMSHEQFIAYREVHCAFWASLSGGGTGDAHEVRRLACAAELNSRRADQLSRAIANLVAHE